jgi:hypothetical protein
MAQNKNSANPDEFTFFGEPRLLVVLVLFLGGDALVPFVASTFLGVVVVFLVAGLIALLGFFVVNAGFLTVFEGGFEFYNINESSTNQCS